VGEQKQVNLL
jgi:hypothetical protein